MKADTNNSSMHYSWYHLLLIPLFLLAITVVVYSPSLQYPFQFDDCPNITKHFNIRHYTLSQLFFSGTRWISYWLNACYYSVVQFNPYLYRVGNVIIHCSNGLVVFIILMMMLGRTAVGSFFYRNALALASLTSALFLLHPVQTQTVSYVIQGQLEGMAALFNLLMILFFLIYSYSSYALVSATALPLLFVVAALSTGTKEIAIISPLILLNVDWFFVARGIWASLKKRILLHTGIFSVVWGSYLYLLKPEFFTNILGFRMKVHNNIGNVITKNVGDPITPFHYFISQFKVVLHYLGIFIWPFNISVEYDWKLVDSFFAPDCFFPLLAVIAMAVSLVWLLKKNRTHCIAFGALWFGICIAPRSTIVPSCELIVDYKTYLASVGWLFIIAAMLLKIIFLLLNAFPSFKQKFERYKGSYALACILLVLLGLATVERNTVWRTGLEFWSNMIHNAPGKARAYNNYGFELAQNYQEYAKAIPYYKKAIAMDKYYRDPYNNLAVSYAALKEIDLAIATLRQSLRIYPYYPEAYCNIGAFLMEKGELDEAEKALDNAIALRAHYGKAFFNKGRLYFNRGNHEEAHAYFKTACLKADFDTEYGFASYGKLSLMLNKYDEAVDGYQRALQFNPNNTEYVFNLANAYYLANDLLQAQAWYQQAIQLAPHDYRAYYNLGETYFKQGDYNRALLTYQKVQSDWATLPQLPLRMAACYINLNKRSDAATLLAQVREHPHIPAPIKSTAAQQLQLLTLS